MRSFFGVKKDAVLQPSTSSVHRGDNNSRTETANSILNLRESIATQEKREKHLEKKMEELVVEAKEKMAKNDKKGALFSLKLKKLHEAELDKIANTKMTLETQVMNLETFIHNAEIIRAMEFGKNAMAAIRKETDIERVEELIDDVKEEMEAASEISNALAQPIDPFVMDEDDLLAELKEEMTADDALGAPVVKAHHEAVAFPTAPTKKLPAIANASKEEAEELAALEAELARKMS
ncbi:hypothetical protein ACHAXA_010800 [Cyclostephanos tholiformis]|uniref:Uncharacterized protein n=1 Tax=Cyclostephanos tholiformis TaxID=382380 RepID=A0ABD3R8E6_9STRA